MTRFSLPQRPARPQIVNLKVSEREAATIDALGALLDLPGGRSGVLRAALDALLDALPAATRADLERIVADATREP